MNCCDVGESTLCKELSFLYQEKKKQRELYTHTLSYHSISSMLLVRTSKHFSLLNLWFSCTEANIYYNTLRRLSHSLWQLKPEVWNTSDSHSPPLPLWEGCCPWGMDISSFCQSAPALFSLVYYGSWWDETYLVQEWQCPEVAKADS